MRSEFALAAALLLSAGAGRAADLTPRVLTVDRASVERRYLGVADADSDTGQRAAIDRDLAQALSRIAPQLGADIVLDRRAVVIDVPSADITAAAEAVMDRTRTPLPGAPPAAPARVSATPDPLFLAEMAKVRKALGASAETSAKTASAISDAEAYRDVPVMGTAAVDVTSDAIARAGADAGYAFAVIDRSDVMTQSLAGKSLIARIERLTQDAAVVLRERAARLRAEREDFEAQLSSLDEPTRRAKAADLDAQEKALRSLVKAYADAIGQSFKDARGKIETALGPILQRILMERGANLLFDDGIVIFVSSDFDVTQTTIARLDGAFPHVTVTMPPLPDADQPSP
jgi:Skp family chaperone for outer membrane proteins